MAAGIADHIWTCEEIAVLLDRAGRYPMSVDDESSWLQSILIGHDLSSVVFVQDYLQLVFQSPSANVRVTAFTMPSLKGALTARPHEVGYAEPSLPKSDRS
jgi:hypothetical protein